MLERAFGSTKKDNCGATLHLLFNFTRTSEAVSNQPLAVTNGLGCFGFAVVNDIFSRVIWLAALT